MLLVRTPYSQLAETRQALPGARWDKSLRAWKVPATPAWLIRARTLSASIEGADSIDELRALRDRAQSGEQVDYAFKTPPWGHQRRMTSYAILSDVSLLDCWMGVGKTKAVLDAIAHRKHARVLVLCPKCVVPVWPAQYEIHGHGGYRVYAPRDGSTDTKAKRLDLLLRMPEPLLTVLNYEVCVERPRVKILDDVTALVWLKSRFKEESALAMVKKPYLIVAQIASDEGLRNELLASGAFEYSEGNRMARSLLHTKWDCVVFDECQKLKSPGGTISRFAAKLKAEHRIGATGTPLPHSLLDAYGIYRALDSGIFGLSFASFRSEYAIMGGYQGHQVFGFKNQDDFKRRFNSIRLHVPGDVLDLPPMQIIDSDVELSAEERKLYDAMEDDFLIELESGTVTAANALAKLLILQQITGGFAYKEGRIPVTLGHSKADVLAELFDELPIEEPVVVFARFREDLQAIARVAQTAGRTCGFLMGGRTDLADWQTGKLNILATQIQAGSLGIDLTRARYAVFFSLGYSLGDYVQALERLHRPGQKHPTFAYRLIAHGTVDRKVARALDKRREVISNLLENPWNRCHNDNA